MRRMINSTYMSIDGVVQDPQHWTFGYRSDDAAQYAHDLLFSVDAVIMGRRTYESFSEVWPNLADETGMADRMNALPKFVASDSLTDPAWNNTTATRVEDFPGLVCDLKEQPGQDIVQYGFGPLTGTLIREQLLDELQIWVHPLFVGATEPADLISHHAPQMPFQLADVRRYDSGVVILRYQPA
ncbi:dihydrofolate reductase family protein [Agromyces sp. SYSU K20354]|uniref:dihydrofolate reductase family protein n=1 Tax=Agromyces cavernae TaxID=2898659 RepID=UPI001E2E8F2C|nr:dihydrofolate reductase family protein [Agromyces cavernae]MCD2444292.1 dihydrofolate reductase family protein [Agromyces cavernae]